jgi:hypothetical protein
MGCGGNGHNAQRGDAGCLSRRAARYVRHLRSPTGEVVSAWSYASTPWAAKPLAVDALVPCIGIDDEAGAKAEAARLAGKVRVASAITGDATVAAYAARWLDDREDRVKSLRSDRARMRLYVLPTLGRLDVRTFTRDHVEGLRDDLDTKIVKGDLAWKTAANVWTVATSMVNDMCNAKRKEFRVRGDNPCRDVKPPDRERTPTRAPLTFHDLRATGITLCAVRGDDPLKIKQRAGHTTFQTTEGHIREGEAVREGFGDVFPPLPECVLGRGRSFGPVSARPELKTKSSQKPGVFRTEGGTRTLTPFRAADFESAASAIPPLRPVGGYSLARKRVDPICNWRLSHCPCLRRSANVSTGWPLHLRPTCSTPFAAPLCKTYSERPRAAHVLLPRAHRRVARRLVAAEAGCRVAQRATSRRS